MNDSVEPRADPQARRAAALLHLYLRRLLLPPAPGHRHRRHSLIERMTHCVRSAERPSQLVYLDERPQRANPIWRAHAWLLRIAALWRPPPPKPRSPPSDAVAISWNANYKLPDDLAYGLGQRYRSVYVLVFFLLALSLICAAVSLTYQANQTLRWVATAGEAVSLLLILGLIVVGIWHNWHQRWIDYRLLAELCRKQQALAPLGWSLPGRAIATLAEEADERGDEPDHAAWVAWFFGAEIRAAPLPQGRFDAATLSEVRRMVLEHLVNDQFDYHAGRRRQYDRAGCTLVRVGELLFLAVTILVGWKLWILARSANLPEWLELLVIVLPTLGAALVGVRAYAELQLLAGQSRHMCGVMRRARERLEQLDLSRPLASQELGAITHAVAITMLQEVDGWARLFRVKVVEAG